MTKNNLKTLLWVLKTQWLASPFIFVWSIFFTIFNGFYSILTTYITAKLITSVSQVAINRDSSNQFYIWAAALFLSGFVFFILGAIEDVLRIKVNDKVNLLVNEMYINKLYSLSLEQFEDAEFNTKVSRARDGMHRIWSANYQLLQLVSTIIGFVGSSAILFSNVPIAGILTIASIVPVAWSKMRQSKNREKAYKEIEPIDRIAYRTRWVLTDYQKMPEIRLLNGFKNLLKLWRVYMMKSQKLNLTVNMKNVKHSAVTDLVSPLIELISNVYLFRLILGGAFGLDRFIFLRGMIQKSASDALQIGIYFEVLHSAFLDVSFLADLQNAEPAIKDGEKLITTPLTIEFKNVSFRYPKSNQFVLNDVNFSINSGDKIALVGENGAGKSTIIKLILRQYLPTSGTITVNGINIQELKLHNYYSAISILNQDPFIIEHLTIKDNLVIGLDKIPSKQKIDEAIELVGLTTVIKKLRDYLSTRLDSSYSDGTKLSGGQLQRVGVARALLKTSDLLLLDEPTSAIDAKAEYSIFNNIYAYHDTKTTLIVSHRFSTVRKANRIIVLEKGVISEQGSHDELMKNDGLYKEMFDIQAEGYR